MTAQPAGGDVRKIWVLAALFSLLWILIGAVSLPHGRAHDFTYNYGAGRTILEGRTGDLYKPTLVWGSERVAFDRPAVAALLYVPFALLPLETAFACYTALWIVLLLICWRWGCRRYGPFAVLLAALFMPATLGLAHAQDCVLYLALLIWSYSLAGREKPFAAGCAIGLMTLKFHLVLLWPVALIFQRRWKMLAGFAAASSLLAALSVAIVGIPGTREYIAALLRPSPFSPSPAFQLSFTGMLANFGIDSIAVKGIGAAAIFALFLVGIRDTATARLYAVTTAASLTLVPHAYGYDAARLLLPIWLVYAHFEWPAAKVAAIVMATPFFYSFTLFGSPWAAAGSIAALTFLAVLAVAPDSGRWHSRREAPRAPGREGGNQPVERPEG